MTTAGFQTWVTKRRIAIAASFGLLTTALQPRHPRSGRPGRPAPKRQILINSTAIMLAIIIPTMIATVAFAWWFRRGNSKATYRPDWEYSGAIEMVVWAHPGADHHAARRDRLDRQP